ncbi:hypothetical protein ACIP29_23580 [Streptomyces coelicoflavus]|uniref:hypothetical protein n=1 Tax=Streptomyces coelicoflavus TaxID=285562 RepID=UPI00380D8F01
MGVVASGTSTSTSTGTGSRARVASGEPPQVSGGAGAPRPLYGDIHAAIACGEATEGRVYAAVQIAAPMWIRTHLAAADRATLPIEPDGGAPLSIQDGAEKIVARLETVPGSWVTSRQTLNAAGQPAPRTVLLRRLPATESGPPARQQVDGRIADLGALGCRQQMTYQPAGSFWALQEAGDRARLGLARPRPGSAPGGSVAG